MRKKTFDVVVGSVLALLAMPVIVALALALAAIFRAWPFFTQDRLGFRGRCFRMVKLRTLRPSVGPYVLKGDLPQGSAPGLAGYLRRLHLDELPQLLLVPRGKLSLVGPRPKMPDLVEPVDAAYGHRRVQVPQGCTGLWQIGLHTDGLPSESPEYDLFYVDHATLRLDLWILWRTGLLLLGLGSRVALCAVPRWVLPVGPPRRSRSHFGATDPVVGQVVAHGRSGPMPAPDGGRVASVRAGGRQDGLTVPRRRP